MARIRFGGLIFLLLFLFPFSQSRGEGAWTVLGLSPQGALFYNAERRVETTGPAKVWVQFVFNQEGKKALKVLGEKGEKAAQAALLYEIDCPERKAECLSFILRAPDGASLGAFPCSGGAGEKRLLFPEALAGKVLLEKFCP